MGGLRVGRRARPHPAPGLCAGTASRQTAAVDVLVTGGTGHLGRRLVGPAAGRRAHRAADVAARHRARRGPRRPRHRPRPGQALAGAQIVVHARQRSAGRPVAGRRRRHPPPGPGRGPRPAAAPGLRLDRRRRPHPVRLLPGQVRRRAGAARLRPAGDPAAGDAVPRLRRRAAGDGAPRARSCRCRWAGGCSRSTSTRWPRTSASWPPRPPTGGVLEFGGPGGAHRRRRWPGRGPRRGAPAPTWWPPRCPGSWARRSGTARRCRRAGRGARRTYAQHLPADDRAGPARSRSGTDGLTPCPETAGNRRTRRLGSDREHADSSPRRPSAAPSAGLGGRTVAAVVVTLLAWASAFVAIRERGGGPLARRARARPAADRHRRARRCCCSAAAGCARRRREWALIAGLRRRLVRHLQPRPQRRRAAPRRRHDGDAGQHRADPDRACFAGLLLGEGFPRWLVAGIAVAFAGVVLIGRRHPRRRDRPARGRALRGRRASPTPAGVVAQKPLLRRLPGLQVTFLACAIGAVCCLPWAGVAGRRARPRRRARRSPAWSTSASVPTALAFSTWAYALRRMDAGRLGRHHVPGAAAGHPAGLAAARRGAARARRSSAARCAWPAWRCPGGGAGCGRRCRSRRRRPARRSEPESRAAR